MSKSSNDLASIRRQQHLKYLNSKYKDSIVVSKYQCAGRKITKAVKKHFFKPPINVSPSEWESIPSLYRVRLTFDHNNFLPTESIYSKPSPKIKPSSEPFFSPRFDLTDFPPDFPSDFPSDFLSRRITHRMTTRNKSVDKNKKKIN